MGRRSQHSQLLRVLKLAAMLLVVAFFVVLLARDAPSPTQSATSGPCAGKTGFFASMLPWLGGVSGASEGGEDVSVCLRGTYDASSLPAEVTCAFPRAKFVTDKTACNVWYSDLSQLNQFETNRKVEANVLSLPPGVLLLQTSNPHTVTTAREMEISFRSGSQVYYAALGQRSTLDVATEKKCKIRQIRAPDAELNPPIYIMMNVASSIFFDTAKSYARIRGYGFLAPSSSCDEALKNIPASWRKIAYLKMVVDWEEKKKKKKSISQDSWVLWLDAQALVTNSEFELEKIIRGPMGNGNILIGQDAQPPYLLNVGTMLAKINPNLSNLLESIWRCGMMNNWINSDSYYWDQNAFTHLAEKGMIHAEFSYWLNSIKLVPHRQLFSFHRQDKSSVDRDLKSAHWRPGDFVASISGIDLKEASIQAEKIKSMQSGDTVKWLNGNHYQFPTRNSIPPMYSIRIDSFFFCEKPTWLHFETEAKNRHTLNPSCIWRENNNNGGGEGEKKNQNVWCVVRTINYNLNLETGYYEWPDVGKTINQFFELSAEEYLHSPGKIIPIPKTSEMFIPVNILSKMHPMRTEGFEDVKMIQIGKTIYGISTCLQMNARFNCEIVLLTIRENNILEALPLRGFRDNECHKNWMPFEFNSEKKNGNGEMQLHLIEQVDPLIILKPDVVAGRANVLYEEKKSHFAHLRLRGTSNGIIFSTGHLFLIHETITRGKEYAHRFLFIQFDERKNVWNRKLSRPFFVIRKTVEFVIGLRMNPEKNKLILGFGFQDVRVGFRQINIQSEEAFLNRAFFWMEEDD